MALAGVLFAGFAAAPATAAAGGDGAKHSSSHWDADGYILSLGETTTSTNISMEELARLRDSMAGDFLWFRRGGKTFRIEDRETLDQARGLFSPLRALEPEQQDLRRRQEALDEQEQDLDRQEEELDRQMDRMDTSSGEEGEEGDEGDESMEQAPPTDAERGEMESQLDELRDQQDELRVRQRKLESSNRELEVVERSLDEREDAIERDAEAKLWALIDAAVKNGVAKPSPRP